MIYIFADIRQKITGGLIDMKFVQQFIEWRWAFLASELSTKDPDTGCIQRKLGACSKIVDIGYAYYRMYTKKARRM